MQTIDNKRLELQFGWSIELYDFTPISSYRTHIQLMQSGCKVRQLLLFNIIPFIRMRAML